MPASAAGGMGGAYVGATTWAEDEVEQLDGLRVRIGSQEWGSLCVDALSSSVASLATSGTTDSTEVFLQRARNALRQIALVQASARAAHGSICAMAAEQRTLREGTLRAKKNCEEARDMTQVRKKRLTAEKIARKRRMEYNALAKVICTLPDKKESERQIEEMNANLESVRDKMNVTEKKLKSAINELALLAQCLRDVQSFADRIEKDLENDNGMKETQSEDGVDRMDIVDDGALEKKNVDTDVHAQKESENTKGIEGGNSKTLENTDASMTT